MTRFATALALTALLSAPALPATGETLRFEHTFSFNEHTTASANKNQTLRVIDRYLIDPAPLLVPAGTYDRIELILRPSGGTTLQVDAVPSAVRVGLEARWGVSASNPGEGAIGLAFENPTGTPPAGAATGRVGFADGEATFIAIFDESSDGPYGFDALILSRDIAPTAFDGDLAFDFNEFRFSYDIPRGPDDPGAFTSIVPEPASIGLLGLLAASALVRRRDRIRS